uniref:hypothetical protein n=1 Tax=uncultured Maribacter sp. TaxID=431308 RepID=UPI00262717DD
MKLPVLTLLFGLCFCFTSYCQIKIGDNPQTIDASSVLELESTSHVLVITRVTTAEMDAITPRPGGMVYNTDTECVHYYNGVEWVSLCDDTGALTNLTTDPIVNPFRTIIITPDGDTNHIEVGVIDGNQIQEGTISGENINPGSITANELAQNSVTSFQIDDRSLLPEDFADDNPNQVFSTDINGIPNWVDANSLTGANADGTTIIGDGNSTPLAVSGTVIADILANTTANANDTDGDENNEIQTLSISGNTISLTNGGTVTLPAATVNTDEQQLSISGTTISLTNGGDIDLPDGTVDTDEQNITGGAIVGNNLRIDIENGNSGLIDISSLNSGGTADGVISNVILNNSNLNFTGTGGGFNGTVDLSGLGGGTNPEFNPATIGGTGTITNPYTIAPNAITAAEIFNGSILSEDILDGTITGNDISNGSVTPVKIQPSLTLGQYLRTDPVTGIVFWDNLPTGTAGTVTTDGITISGDGSSTVLQVIDGSISPVKIQPAPATITENQMLITDFTNGTVTWANIPTGGNVTSDTTLDGDGNTTPLSIADDAITLPKLQDGTAPGQLLQWNGTDWEFITEADISATVTEVDGIIGNEISQVADATLLLTGTGTVGDPLTVDVADNGITTNEIADNAITLPKLQDGTTPGQLLQWNGTDWEFITEADISATVTEVDG